MGRNSVVAIFLPVAGFGIGYLARGFIGTKWSSTAPRRSFARLIATYYYTIVVTTI
jgi:hypothetical protein